MRRAGIVLACLALAACVTVAFAAAHVVRAGSVGLEYRSDAGDQVQVRLPAVVAGLAIRAVPDEAIRDALGEEAAGLLPALRAGLQALREEDDFVLLEVRDRGSRVRVEKVRDRILVSVDDGGEWLSVALPLDTAGVLLRKLSA